MGKDIYLPFPYIFNNSPKLNFHETIFQKLFSSNAFLHADAWILQRMRRQKRG